MALFLSDLIWTRSRHRASAFRSLLSGLHGVLYLLSMRVFPHGSCATHVSSREPSTWRLLRDFSVVSVLVNEGNGCETRKTSKGLTKSKHCGWVGPQPCTIFCFMLTHCAWLTRHKRFQWLNFQFTYAGVFLFYAGSRLKKLNKRIEHIDYYMLRAWYRFYSRVFNTMHVANERVFERVSGMILKTSE